MAASSTESEIASSPVFHSMASTRQGSTFDGQTALSEVKFEFDGRWQPASAWRVGMRAQWIQETALERREYQQFQMPQALLEYAAETCTVRLGTQKVVWGHADYFRVLNLLHPSDFREGLLGTSVAAWIPLDMLESECGNTDSSVQWLLVPVSPTHRYASPGARFYGPNLRDQIAASPLARTFSAEPDWRQPENWSTGLRWSGQIGHASVELAGLNAWQPDPVYRIDTLSSSSTPGYRVQRERMSMLGASVEMPLGPSVLRTEWSTSQASELYTNAAEGLPNAANAVQDRSLAGVDYQGTDWFLSVQYFFQLTQPTNTQLGQQSQRMISLGARRDLLQGRMNTTIFLAHDLIDPAVYMSVNTQFELSSGLLWRISLDHFSGSQSSFGLFSSQSRVVTELRYELY